MELIDEVIYQIKYLIRIQNYWNFYLIIIYQTIKLIKHAVIRIL